MASIKASTFPTSGPDIKRFRILHRPRTAILTGFAVVVGFSALVEAAAPNGGTNAIGLAVIALLAAWSALAFGRSVVQVSAGSVEIRGAVSTQRYAISDVDRVQLGTVGRGCPCAVLILRSGESIPLKAIWIRSERHGLSRLDAIIAQMNLALRQPELSS